MAAALSRVLLVDGNIMTVAVSRGHRSVTALRPLSTLWYRQKSSQMTVENFHRHLYRLIKYVAAAYQRQKQHNITIYFPLVDS